MPPAPWYIELAARTGRYFAVKFFGISAFITLFFIAYLHLLNNPAFPVTVMPLTPVDQAIAFQPGALSIYLSLWIYVGLPPAFLYRRGDLVAYLMAITGVCAAGLACFFFWPTAVPILPLDWQAYPGSNLLKGVDAAGNACPSLHVATAVFSGIWLHRLLKEIRAPLLPLLGNFLWCAGIVYSTLATKQHVFVDVTAGTVLGALGAWSSIAWYGARGERPQLAGAASEL